MLKMFQQYKGLRKENYILFVGRIVTNLGSMVWPVLTLILNQKLGMNATTVAIVMIVAGVIQMPLGLLGGRLADTHNKKNIIVLFDAISIIFYIICALIPLSYITIGLMLIAATCQSMENPAYTALIADLTLTKDRERAYSLSYLGSNIGLVASPTIAGILFNHHLWLAFLISGIAIAISTVLIFFFIQDITPMKEEDTSASAYQNIRDDASMISILKENKVVLLYVVIMALYWGAYGQYGYLMPLDMARVHGESGAVIYGSVSSLNCIIVVIFTPILTHLFMKLCATKKNLVGVVTLLVGYVIFLVGLGFIPSYYIAITLFTFGEILTTIVSGPYLTERTPASHRGRINGVMTVIQTIIGNATMLAVGLFYDHSGSVAAWIFVFVLLGISLIGSIALIGLDRRRYKKLYE